MNKKLIPVLLLLFILSCSKEEPINFRIYDLDIYAIPLDEEAKQQEVFASAKVEGFKAIREEGNYKFHILLKADLVTPDNRTIQSIAVLDTVGTQSEKFGKYLNLEVSFILDETYPHGNYQLILNGKDLLSEKTAEVKQDFNLD